MDEAGARHWLETESGVPRETIEKLGRFVALLRDENRRQNLVSAASLEQVWSRHIVDSAQLIRFAPPSAQSWIDLGTGAGFPGLVVAMLHCSKVTLVEARPLRADFLRRSVEALGLSNVEVVCAKAERVEAAPFDVVSARAFAPLDRLLSLGLRFAAPATRWILPKGRNAKSELVAAKSLWQGDFRIEPSLTDAQAGIIVAERVGRRKRGDTGQ
jgi:16S rRNA (guanine527-N7)-methyltransferase